MLKARGRAVPAFIYAPGGTRKKMALIVERVLPTGAAKTVVAVAGETIRLKRTHPLIIEIAVRPTQCALYLLAPKFPARQFADSQ
jgi:hypothetical protein